MSLNSLHIKVAVPLPVKGLYTYGVPTHLADHVNIGMRVLVPFGPRILGAYVIDFAAKMPDRPTKALIDVLDDAPLFPTEMVPFFIWISDYYIYPIGEVIKHALPSGLKIHDRIGLRITKSGLAALADGRISAKEQALLEKLARHAPKAYLVAPGRADTIAGPEVRKSIQKGWIEKTKEIPPQKANAQTIQKVSIVPEAIRKAKLSEARRKIVDYIEPRSCVAISQLKTIGPNAISLARKMEKNGQLNLTHERAFRDPLGDPIAPDRPPRLTPEQLVAIARMKSTIGEKYQTYLLSGVTGSGKTEIYLQLTAHTLSLDLTVLVLVPEIALISQVERRFRARFGNSVAVLHSSLSTGEHFDQWEQVAMGKIPICIGARSAIFAPLTGIGLIVVDEEHDTSYKQEESLRYNARDLAVIRGHQSNATVILGSATPSIQSYYNATIGKFVEIPLQHRVAKRPLPEIEIVDLSRDKEITGTRRFITPPLYKAIESTIHRGEQALLFLNRRGFASFPICVSCQEPFKCKNCDISLTLHKSINGFKCHFCGYSRPATAPCVHCGSTRVRYLGMGTEKIEAAVKKLFPGVSVARMDRDTTARKGALLKILKALNSGEIQILVGTQMIAKGHDFPNITLVGIICADLSLSFPDFRAGERTFQLLAQVAGRSGRGEQPGKVILQSYQPDHFSITAAQKQDFRQFYRHEIPFRKALNYPPFSRLIQIRISSKNKDSAASQAQVLSAACLQLKNKNRDFASHLEILGPIEAPIFRVAQHYRFHMILKCPKVTLLRRFMAELSVEALKNRNPHNVRIDIDVDPFFML